MNPLYWPLRWFSRTGWASFPRGYTPSRSRLRPALEQAGLEVTASATLIRNPRMLSTVLSLGWVPAPTGESAVLAAFECLERLPTRGFTACFLATRAVRSETATGPLLKRQ